MIACQHTSYLPDRVLLCTEIQQQTKINALVHPQSSIINHQSSVISHQSSVISHQSSVISHQPSAISHQSSAISHQPSVIRHQSSVISHQSSIISLTYCFEQANICQISSLLYSIAHLPSATSEHGCIAPTPSANAVQVAKVDSFQLSQYELYSSRVKEFEVRGRQAHPRAQGGEYSKSLNTTGWQLMGKYTAAKMKGSQVCMPSCTFLGCN